MTVYFKKYRDAICWMNRNDVHGVIRYNASEKMYGIYSF